jgi:hypothetical protein
MKWTRVWNRIEGNSLDCEGLEHLRHDAKLRLWQNLFWDALLRREFGCELTIMRVPSLPMFDEVEILNNNIDPINPINEDSENNCGNGRNLTILHSLAAHEDSDSEEDEEEYGFEDYDVRKHSERRFLTSFHGTAWERHCENKKLEMKIGALAFEDMLKRHEKVVEQNGVLDLMHGVLWELNGVDVYWDGEVDDHPELEKSDYYFCVPKVREEVHNFTEQKREIREITRKAKPGTPGFGTLHVTAFPFHAELLMENGDVCCFALYDQSVTVDDVVSNVRITYHIERDFESSFQELHHLLELNLSDERVVKLREMRMRLRALDGKSVKIGKSSGVFNVIQERGEESSHPVTVSGKGTISINDSNGFLCQLTKAKKNWIRRIVSRSSMPIRNLVIPDISENPSDASLKAKEVCFSELSPFVDEEEFSTLFAAFRQARKLQAREMEHKEEILPASFHVCYLLDICFVF